MPREDIRIRVAGIYTENNQILLVKHRKFGKEYYLLPGGGQQTGEDMRSALVREWKEELNLDIVAGEFLFMGESIPPDTEQRKHVAQIVFSVKSIQGAVNLQADDTLVGCSWVEFEKLPGLTLYPRCMEQILGWLNKENSLFRYSRYIWQ